MLNESSPIILAILSEKPPAQLTTYRARIVSCSTTTPSIAFIEPEPPTFISATPTFCSPLISAGNFSHGPPSPDSGLPK